MVQQGGQCSWNRGKESEGGRQRAVGDEVRRVVYQPPTTVRVLDFIPVWEILGAIGERTDMVWVIVLKNESGRCDKNSGKDGSKKQDHIKIVQVLRWWYGNSHHSISNTGNEKTGLKIQTEGVLTGFTDGWDEGWELPSYSRVRNRTDAFLTDFLLQPIQVICNSPSQLVLMLTTFFTTVIKQKLFQWWTHCSC